MYLQERRRADRFPLDSKGCAIINGSNFDLKTHDVSEGGALVEFAVSLALKKGAKLRVRLNIGFIGRAVVCRVNARNNRNLYSLKFDRFDFHSDLALCAYFVKYGHQMSGVAALH